MSPDQHLKKLITLGLTSYEAKVYLALIGRNSHTASEIASFSGVPRQRVYDVLGSLHLKGLCVELPGKVVRYHASKPKDALLGMLVERNQDFQKELEVQRDTAVQLSQELAALGLQDEGSDSAGKVEILLHPNQMLKRYDELLLEAEEEILSTARRPYVQARAEATYEKIKEGVTVKFLVHDEVLAKDPFTPRAGCDIKKLSAGKNYHRLRVGPHRFRYLVEGEEVFVEEAFRRGRGYMVKEEPERSEDR